VKNIGSASPRLLVVGLIVIAAGAAGFVAYQRAQTPAVESPLAAAPAVEDSEPTPPPPKPERKAVPETLPEITLADVDGKPTALSSFAGRPLMVNFWATWCAPCRREIPLLNKIREQRKAQNAEIVGIAVDFRDKVLEFTKNTRIDYPLLIGEEDGLAAAEAFGMGMGFPFSVFVDSKSRILTVKVGELHEDEANFAFDRLRDVDAGLMTLKTAQAQVSDAFRQMAADRARAEAAAGPDAEH
jgi:thiol-disulfide isomerase/thioredoxin